MGSKGNPYKHMGGGGGVHLGASRREAALIAEAEMSRPRPKPRDEKLMDRESRRAEVARRLAAKTPETQ